MTRTRVLFGRRRFQLLGVLAAVLVAAAAVYGSGASFTSTSANASNVFTGGILEMANDQAGAVLTVERMVPGEVREGTVTIQNTGDVVGNFFLEPITITGATANFDGKLQLRIDTGWGYDLYEGPLSDLAQIDLGYWQPNESRSYTFIVSFPDTGRGANGVGNENSFQNAMTTARFDWTAISVPDAFVSPTAGN